MISIPTRSLLVLGLLASPLASQTPEPQSSRVPAPTGQESAPAQTSLEEQVRAASTELENLHAEGSYPALSVAVARDGRILWAKAVGHADLEKEIPADTETRFRIGSTSKALTATLAAMLVDSGELDLDAPVTEYLEGHEHWTFTPRQLAGHQAGIRHYNAGEYFNRTRYDSVTGPLAIFEDDPLLFEPGTQYHYSTYGYTVLSAVLEAAAGERFLDLIERRLFVPLGMKNTLPEWPDRNRANRATYYGPNAFGYGRAPAQAVDNSNKWAGGGFESTPSDLATFGTALLGTGLVRPETRDLLFTPQTFADGSPTGEAYGIGFRKHTKRWPASQREVEIVHHGGTSLGGRSFLVLIPSEDLAISLLGNYHSRMEPYWDFADMALALGEHFLSTEVPGTDSPPDPKN